MSPGAMLAMKSTGRFHRALVEELEHGVLRVGPHPTPSDRRGRPVHRLLVRRHPLTVRFHLELLEIAR